MFYYLIYLLFYLYLIYLSVYLYTTNCQASFLYNEFLLVFEKSVLCRVAADVCTQN